jgi:hypothetical protein
MVTPQAVHGGAEVADAASAWKFLRLSPAGKSEPGNDEAKSVIGAQQDRGDQRPL